MSKEKHLKIKSFFALFSLMASIFLLRPFRDVLGIYNGVHNLQWLFTATLIGMIPLLFLFRYFSSRYSIKVVVNGAYVGFVLLLFLFYLSISLMGMSKNIARLFFVYTSVSSLYSISLFWIVMVNSFSTKAAKNIFGFVAAGGSLGALLGSFLYSLLVSLYSIEYVILTASSLLLIALVFMNGILNKKENKRRVISSFSTFIFDQKFWKKLQKTTNHKYLLSIIIFMLLYSSISTILYFEQVYLVEDFIIGNENRLRYFSRIDTVVNCISIFGQLFITKWFIRKYTISLALSIIPVILIVGFMIINFKTSLLFVSVLVVIHKAGNYILIKPAREMLFTVCTREEKYRIKNFIDTIIYRSGDAFMGWIFTALISVGFGLSLIALVTIPILFHWMIVGRRLGKYQKINSKEYGKK